MLGPPSELLDFPVWGRRLASSDGLDPCAVAVEVWVEAIGSTGSVGDERRTSRSITAAHVDGDAVAARAENSEPAAASAWPAELMQVRGMHRETYPDGRLVPADLLDDRVDLLPDRRIFRRPCP